MWYSSSPRDYNLSISDTPTPLGTHWAHRLAGAVWAGLKPPNCPVFSTLRWWMKRAERFVGIKASVSLASWSFVFILGFNSEHLYHLLFFLKQRVGLGLIQPQQSLRCCWPVLGPWGAAQSWPGTCTARGRQYRNPFQGCRRGTGRTNGKEKKKKRLNISSVSTVGLCSGPSRPEPLLQHGPACLGGTLPEPVAFSSDGGSQHGHLSQT